MELVDDSVMSGQHPDAAVGGADAVGSGSDQGADKKPKRTRRRKASSGSDVVDAVLPSGESMRIRVAPEPAKEDADGEQHAIVARVSSRYVRARAGATEDTPVTYILGTQKFSTKPAVVRRGYGVTLNMGNYETARIDVSLELPCYVEDLEAADEWAAKWCEHRIEQEIRAMRSGGKS